MEQGENMDERDKIFYTKAFKQWSCIHCGKTLAELRIPIETDLSNYQCPCGEKSLHIGSILINKYTGEKTKILNISDKFEGNVETDKPSTGCVGGIRNTTIYYKPYLRYTYDIYNDTEEQNRYIVKMQLLLKISKMEKDINDLFSLLKNEIQIIRDRIVQLFGDLPRIELFARQKIDGWDSWGNEIESDIEIEI